MRNLIALHLLKYSVARYAALLGDLRKANILSFKWIFSHEDARSGSTVVA